MLWHYVSVVFVAVFSAFVFAAVRVDISVQESNNIGDEGAVAVGRGLSVNNSLQYLFLVSCFMARMAVCCGRCGMLLRFISIVFAAAFSALVLLL